IHDHARSRAEDCRREPRRRGLLVLLRLYPRPAAGAGIQRCGRRPVSIDEQIKALEQEMTELQLPHFDAGTAWQIGCALRDRADKEGKRIAIEVSRPGQQLFYCVMPGIAPDSAA